MARFLRPATALTLLTACSNAPPIDHVARRAAHDAQLRVELGDAWDQPVPGLADADLQIGRSVWDRSCLPCHGIGGAGDGRLAPRSQPRPPDLRISRLPPAAELHLIRNGSPDTSMPPWSRSLSADQTLSALAWLLELRKTGPPSR